MVRPELKILLVEDNPGDARFIREMLGESRQINHTVTVAENMSDAVSHLSKFTFDTIILDLNLPDSSGLATLDIVIKSTEGLVPVIVLTGINDEETGISAIERGAEDYLIKGEVNPAQLVHSIRYAIERVKAETALRESEEIFRQFMEHSPIYVFFKDDRVRSLRLSKNYEKMLGKPIDELLGKTMDELFPSDLAKSMIADDLQILDEGKQVAIEEELNGRFYQTIKFPILQNGKPRYLAGYSIDITERLKAEEAIRKSEEKYRNLIETTPCIICRIKPDGTTIFVNSYVKVATGYAAEELIGRNWWDVFYPGDLRGQISLLFDAFKAGDVHRHEMTLLSGDGSSKTISWDSFNEYGANGALIDINGVGIDITESKRAEVELQSQLKELKRWHAVTIDREGRMQELKKEVNDLLKEAGRPVKYGG